MTTQQLAPTQASDAPGDGPVRVLAIGGSTRPGSSSEKALRIAAEHAEQAGAEVELITGRALMLPIYDTETEYRSPEAVRLVAALCRAEAVIISSPGYHGTMSGMMKNALDYVEDLRRHDRVYLDGLAVGCIAVAYGWQATVSTLQNLRVAAHALRGWPTPLGAAINASGPVFTEDGNRCCDGATGFQLQTVGTQVVEFARMRRLMAPFQTSPQGAGTARARNAACLSRTPTEQRTGPSDSGFHA